jgi:hypothetical protein
MMWKRVHFIIIDAPNCLGNHHERISYVSHHFIESPRISFARYWKSFSMDDILRWRLCDDLKGGGMELNSSMEGYRGGRNFSTMNVKVKWIFL